MGVGIILVLVGVVALAGATSATWVMWALVIWLTCYFLFGRGRRLQRQHQKHLRKQMRYGMWAASSDGPQQPPYPLIPAAPPPRPPAAQKPKPVTPPAQLPPDVAQKADRISRKAAALAQHADRFPLGSHDLYVVQQTPTAYLPETIKAFQDVPSWSINTPAADGRTPLKMLHDQLDILEAKLDEIAENVKKQRVDRLLMNERFLEQNFGRGEEELTIPRQQRQP